MMVYLLLLQRDFQMRQLHACALLRGQNQAVQSNRAIAGCLRPERPAKKPKHAEADAGSSPLV